MADYSFDLWILLDVLIACALGGALGCEREQKDKPAGFRTNMFIAAGATLLLSLGRYIANSMELEIDPAAMGVNSTRIIHSIIVGVSFIGVGTIVKNSDEHMLKYLMTAATNIFSTGNGMRVAHHLYLLVVGSTILELVINALFRKLY